VVDLVETPQKRDFVVQDMPDIEHEVQENHRCDHLGPIRYVYQIENTQLISTYIESGLKDRCGKKQPEDNAVEDAQADIVHPPFELRNRARPVWD
jgi:hypothetical protein